MRRTRLPMTLTVASATIAVMVGVSACGSGGSSTTSSTTTNAGAPPASSGGGGSKSPLGEGPGAPPKARSKHPAPRHHHGPPGTKMQHTYAAQIVSHGATARAGGPIQPAELWPVTNSWRVSDHKSFTAVYAGANPDHHATGRLVVFRQDFVHVKQTADDVDVHGSGPVTITMAPTGARVGTSAQRDGQLQFRGANGVTGTLHLSNDTVTLGSG
jgi:hypothetical protein